MGNPLFHYDDHIKVYTAYDKANRAGLQIQIDDDEGNTVFTFFDNTAVSENQYVRRLHSAIVNNSMSGYIYFLIGGIDSFNDIARIAYNQFWTETPPSAFRI